MSEDNALAELAKVKVIEVDYLEREGANIAFLNCRKIAEEGDVK